MLRGLTTLAIVVGIVGFLLLSAVHSITDRFVDWRESSNKVEIAQKMRQNLIDMQSGATTRTWLQETQETARLRIHETEETKRVLGVTKAQETTKRLGHLVNVFQSWGTVVLAMLLCSPLFLLLFASFKKKENHEDHVDEKEDMELAANY